MPAESDATAGSPGRCCPPSPAGAAARLWPRFRSAPCSCDGRPPPSCTQEGAAMSVPFLAFLSPAAFCSCCTAILNTSLVKRAARRCFSSYLFQKYYWVRLFQAGRQQVG